MREAEAERREAEAMRGFVGSWLITGDVLDPPIERGAAVLNAERQTVAVGPAPKLRKQYPEAAWQEVEAVLMPGLVNAHLHLELSGLAGKVPGGRGFVPWLQALLEAREGLQETEQRGPIAAAIGQLERAGTVAIGEVSNRLTAVPILAAAPLIGRVFHEVYGLTKETAELAVTEAQRQFQTLTHWPPNLSRVLAPHSVYGLHPEVLEKLVRDARRDGLVTSLHLAEHRAERAFLWDGGGPFGAFAAGRSREGSVPPPPHMGPIEYALELGALGPGVLTVHLTDASDAELHSVGKNGAHVVLCPRSNRFIEGHMPKPAALLEAGAKPALGTDSLASNDDLDVLREATALLRGPAPPPARTLLAMLTSFGADALGVGSLVGRLQRGLQPGLLGVFHEQSPAPTEPEAFVLDEPDRPRALLCRGAARIPPPCATPVRRNPDPKST